MCRSDQIYSLCSVCSFSTSLGYDSPQLQDFDDLQVGSCHGHPLHKHMKHMEHFVDTHIVLAVAAYSVAT